MQAKPLQAELTKSFRHHVEAYENGGIARDGAKMVNAVACVDVPKMPGLRSDLGKTKATGGCSRQHEI